MANKEEQNTKDVRNIVTADAPYAGNVMRIPSDIPAGVVAGGVPCKVIRPITEADRIKPEEIKF